MRCPDRKLRHHRIRSRSDETMGHSVVFHWRTSSWRATSLIPFLAFFTDSVLHYSPLLEYPTQHSKLWCPVVIRFIKPFVYHERQSPKSYRPISCMTVSLPSTAYQYLSRRRKIRLSSSFMLPVIPGLEVLVGRRQSLPLYYWRLYSLRH